MVLMDDRLQNLDERPSSPPGVVTVVASLGELKKLPYWRQGNDEMYTDFHLAARRHNRDAPTVLAALQGFWSAVIYDPAEPDEPGQDDDGYQKTITRERYLDIYGKISRALDKASAAQAVEDAETAWEQDTTGDVLIFTRGKHRDLWFLAR